MSGTNGYGNGGNGYGNLSDEEKLRMLHDRRDEQRRKEEAARRVAAARRRIEGSARGRAAADTDSSYGTGRGQGSSYNRGSARTGSYSGGYGSGASSGRRYPEHRGLRDEEEREEAYSASGRSASHSGAKTRRTDRTASGRGEKVTAGAGASKGAAKTRKKRAFSGIRNPLNKLPVNIRKTIRLTTAGVLAVSAIVVAAIPGNSLRAADELPELQEYIEKSSYEYTVSDNRSGSGKKETRFEDKNGNIIETCDSSFGSGEYYTPVNDSNLSLYHQNPSGVDVQRSYKITSSSSSGKTTYTNTYQFDYYMTSVSGQNNVGVICGYNSKTLTGGVTIDKNNFPTEYIDVDDYTSVEAAVSDSTVSYSYNYDNWASDGYKSSATDLSAFDATASANFLYRYYHDNYVNAIAEYESSEYYQYDKAEDKSAWTEPPTKPTNSIVGTVAGISGSEYRYNWYLDYTQKSPYGQGMTYIPTVKYDDTHDGNTVLTAYCPSEADGYWFAPHGSAGNLKPGYGLDTDNNFIYDSDPQVMIAAIGDYAFAGMTSIDGLQLEGILYIGDYAFAGSTVLKSVDLTNVQHIGNGAFYSCPMLATVFSSDTENTQGSQVAVIGAQAFYNCSALTAFEYPTMLQTIGAGAFAYCSNLQAANFNATQNTVTIGDYAFFNDYSMSSLSFFGENSTGTQTTDSTHHWNIGTGAFAMAMDETSSDNLSTIYFPANIDNLNNGSDWLVAGRTNLKYVHMPANFGSGDVRLPVSTFIDCSGLEFVRFPEGTGKVCMNPYTFYDVTNSNFYVEGPANRDDSNIAYQREDTWASRDHSGRSIPYKIVDTETYEAVSTENDNLIIQYEGISDQNAALTLVFQRTTHSSKGSVPHSYTATSDPDMTLAIPETVASYLITKIGNGTDCVIDQSMLNDSNKVTRIKVPYTVTEVSDNAFKDTRYVTQIDFEYGGHDVAVGEDAFYIGDSATGLLINGKIDADYGPFAYAAAGNTMNKANTPTHICYRGNTSSDIGLVTIYDKDKSVMTLVDYPKTFELDREYAEEMADSWYDYYEKRNSKTERDRFMSNYLLGYDENGNLASVSKCVYDYTVDNESGPYGPWISDSFCDDFAIEVASYINDNYENWASQWAGSGSIPALKDLLNTVASSISTTPPKPYFEQHPYSIIEKVLGAPSNNIWETHTTANEEEYALVNACKELNIPAGIKSIDVTNFIANNSTAGGDSFAYLDPSVSDYGFVSNGQSLSYTDAGGATVSYTTDEWKMYTDTTLSANGLTPYEGSSGLTWPEAATPWQSRTPRLVQPGLFSGQYTDGSDKSGDSTYERGNDDLTMINAPGLIYLPPYAFDSCENLTTIALGDLQSIGDESAGNMKKGYGVFRGCYDLVTSGVSLGGTTNYVLDANLNALTDAAGTTIYAAVPGSAGTLDLSGNATVTGIMEGAYEDCPNLSSVNLTGTGITTIPFFAFADCPSLGRYTYGKSKDVRFPSGLNKVLNYAFNGDYGVTFYVPSNTTSFGPYAIEGGTTNKDLKPAQNWFVLPDTYLTVDADGSTVTDADFDNCAPASYAWNDYIDGETGRHIGLYANTGITLTIEDMDTETTTILTNIAIDQDDMTKDSDGNYYYDLGLSAAQSRVKTEIDSVAEKISSSLLSYYEDLENYYVKSSLDVEDVERVGDSIPTGAGALEDSWNNKIYGDTVIKAIEKIDYRTLYFQFTGAKSGTTINFNMNVVNGRKATLAELIKEYDEANGTDYYSEVPDGVIWTLTYNPTSSDPADYNDKTIYTSTKVEIDAAEEGSSMTFSITNATDSYEITFADGTGNNTSGYPFKHTYSTAGTIIPSTAVQLLGYAVPSGTKSWHSSETGKYYSLTASIAMVNGMTLTATTTNPNSEGGGGEEDDDDVYTITFRTYDMQTVLRTLTKPIPTDGSTVTLSNNDLAFYYTSSGTAKYYPRYIVYEPDVDSGKYFTAASSSGTPVYEVIDDTKILCYLKNSSHSSKSSSSGSSSTKKYKVTVNKGTVDGSKSTATYASGATVTIIANAPETGKAFQKWQVDSGDITLANETSASTTFTMPSSDVTVTAVYTSSINANRNSVANPATGTTATKSSGGSSGGGTSRGATATPTSMTTTSNPNVNAAQVIVSRPGIDNVGLASAVVHGTDQSLVVRVSQTNEATFAAENALKWKYGDDCIDSGRIVDWPCDISLYDASGEHKIEDTTGITVDITLPIPNDLKEYGGNNMAGAVSPTDGSLETLGTKFNSVNGTPVMTFTAMHFSPYVLYADTQNLDASLMDVTPQTGDPLSLKWILVIGLGAASAFLFLKKEKVPGTVSAGV